MNGKKAESHVAIEIHDLAPSKITKRTDSGKVSDVGGLSCLSLGLQVYDFCKEDVNRVTFSLKVGLAVLLVSLLILIREPYEVFGTNIIWAILTVAIMFEYTVGATFSKGFNRALGSLFAGILAVTIAQIAIHGGHVGEPLIIGISIFFIEKPDKKEEYIHADTDGMEGAAASFLKQWPSMAPYEYGFRVMLFTYCLIIVSGYRMGGPTRTAMDRLYAIAMGAVVTLLVNVLIFPIWAGEQLHRELVKSFDAVADSIEVCVKKYLSEEGLDQLEFEKAIKDEFSDEPAFKRCQSILNSASKFDSMASSAKWEPPHGRFWHFFYPWDEYVKVGTVLRHCAYEVMALHGCIHSEIQAPYGLRLAFQTEIQDAGTNAAQLLRSLGKEINAMKLSLQNGRLLQAVHAAAEQLQRSIQTHSYLLAPDHLGAAKPACKLTPAPSDQDHDLMKKQQRRLYSWPSREVDGFGEEGEGRGVPRMRTLESTSALSFATFTSLLIEFIARLDHLVEAVDELAKLARFKEDGTTDQANI